MEGLEENKLLYSDEKIKIYDSGVPDEHHVLVGENYCFFDRGILRDLAEMHEEMSLEDSVRAINRNFLINLINSRVSIAYFGWALAKARIKEVEKERDYFIEKSR